MWWVSAYLGGSTLSWAITDDVIAEAVGRRSDLALERDPKRPADSLKLVYARSFTERTDAVDHLDELYRLRDQALMELVVRENPTLTDLIEEDLERVGSTKTSIFKRDIWRTDFEDPPGGVPARVSGPQRPLTPDSSRMSWPETEGE